MNTTSNTKHITLVTSMWNDIRYTQARMAALHRPWISTKTAR